MDVDITGCYATITGISVFPFAVVRLLIPSQSFEPKFEVANGINHPKVLTCRGTDGRRYRQLVKARPLKVFVGSHAVQENDDMRQDAVMQQAFTMINLWLQRDPETRRRNLSIRTYKCVPLRERAGALWSSAR